MHGLVRVRVGNRLLLLLRLLYRNSESQTLMVFALSFEALKVFSGDRDDFNRRVKLRSKMGSRGVLLGHVGVKLRSKMSSRGVLFRSKKGQTSFKNE